MKDIFKRKGKVKINKHLMFSMGEQMLKPFFTEFYPLEITYTFNDIIEYTCISNRFESVNEIDPIPHYEIIFTIKNDLLVISKVYKI